MGKTQGRFLCLLWYFPQLIELVELLSAEPFGFDLLHGFQRQGKTWGGEDVGTVLDVLSECN
ncbi:MAG: hypothetical protein ACYCVD_13310 [Desulfitobacteriaceae bacterium]